MHSSRRLFLLFLLVLFIQCATKEREEEQQIPLKPVVGDVHVFFVGNSLTYSNDLPELVKEIAAMDGVDLTYKMHAFPNFSLDDHLTEGSIQSELKNTQYDFLIAQQGPSALSESQVLLREAAIKIGNECKTTNTTFGLYMVWPSLDRGFDRGRCISSYTKAAEASDALLCPAGLAWKLAWDVDGKMPLYGGDGFHPSIHGSVLAAMVIYASIKNKTDLDFINASKWERISHAQLDVMKTAAIASLSDR